MPWKHRGSDTPRARASSTAAQAASTLKTISSAGPASSKVVGKRRSALTDATNFIEFFNKTVDDVEAEVHKFDKPNYTHLVLRTSELALDHFIEHLALREVRGRLKRQGKEVDKIKLTEEDLKPVVTDFLSQISANNMSDSLKDIVNDKKIWVGYLHMYAMTGQGQINKDNSAHTNLRRHYSAVRTSRQSRSGDAEADHPASLPFEPAVLDPALAMEGSSTLSRPIRGQDTRSTCTGTSQQTELIEDRDEQEDSSEEEYLDDIEDDDSSDDDDCENDAISEDEEDNPDAGPELDLDDEDLHFVSAFESSPVATPLALHTLTKRVDNIFRQFDILKVSLRPQLRPDVIKIVRYLARRKHLYPTASRKKLWISSDTVAAMRAGVWTALAHDARLSARSLQTLLSVHLMIMFLDELGGRVTSWIDKARRAPGEEGRYLRWGMVHLTFCGYSDSGNPEFKLNISSSSSKGAARMGDANFHANTLATKKDQSKSQDIVFCMAALGVSQQVFADDVQAIFTNHSYGSSLLRRSRVEYDLPVKQEFVDCAVFLFGRTQIRQPQHDIPVQNTNGFSKHASDQVAWGSFHQPMKTSHLNASLRVISQRLGLAQNVTSRTFRTTYAFKSVLEGAIPGWRIASRMGHFGGDKDLSRKTYVPTFGPVETSRTASLADAARTFSDKMQRSLQNNGTIVHLPDPGDVDQILLQKARSLLELFQERLEESDGKDEERNDLIAAMSDGIVETFRRINSGTRVPFKESLGGLLSLTSASQVRWTTVAEQGHPFDDANIGGGSDAVLLQWILGGATYLCPSCHTSFHLDELDSPQKCKPSDLFRVFNKCLKATRGQFCCFVCSKFVSVEEGDHAIKCFLGHYDEKCSLGLQFDKICVSMTASSEHWKKSTFFVCPVESCLDQAWNTRPNANDKSYLDGIGAIQHANTRKSLLEIADESLKVNTSLGKSLNHLAAHFFETNIAVSANQKMFKVNPRLPVTADGRHLICPIRNCDCQWHNSATNSLAFIAHLVNVHKFPILYRSDFSEVEEIREEEVQKLKCLLPYIPTWIGGMGDVAIPNPQLDFDGFYVRVDYDVLRLKVANGYKSSQHSGKVSPALKKQRKSEVAKASRSRWTEEKKAAEAERKKQAYLKRKSEQTEDERESRRQLQVAHTKKYQDSRKHTPEFKKKKSEADKRYKDKKREAKRTKQTQEEQQASPSSSRQTLD